MMKVAGWVCVFLAVVSADPETTLYKKVGDDVVLQPGAAPVNITTIIWKNGPNLAMEWDGPGTDITSYRHFQVRGSLNISNGAMTITGLTRDDSGLYTVEINNLPASTTSLTVIYPVPTPTVFKSCDDEANCVLTCDGNTTYTEPVTYKWRSDDTVSTDSSKAKRITKEDSSSIKEFSCELQNPVSQERSQPISNPFITPSTPPTPAPGPLKISTGLTVFISLLAAVLVLVIFHRWKAGMWFFQQESMPWEAGFWSKQERPPRDAAESNGTTTRGEKAETDEETPMR